MSQISVLLSMKPEIMTSAQNNMLRSQVYFQCHGWIGRLRNILRHLITLVLFLCLIQLLIILISGNQRIRKRPLRSSRPTISPTPPSVDDLCKPEDSERQGAVSTEGLLRNTELKRLERSIVRHCVY